MGKLAVPIIPVYLEPHSKEKSIELPLSSSSSPITGSELKESVMVCHGTPKNRQIVVVFDSNFAINKIVHDESQLSDSDIANVCVLECRLGVVDIHVQVRWPRESGCKKAAEQRITLHMSLDDKVSEIKRIIGSKLSTEIEDSMILINDRMINLRDSEKSLSHYPDIVSNSTVKLIIIKHSDATSSNQSTSISMPTFPKQPCRGTTQRPSNIHATPQPKMNPSASMPDFANYRRGSVQFPCPSADGHAYTQRQLRFRQKKSATMSLPTLKSESPDVKPKHQCSNVSTLPPLIIGQTPLRNRQGSGFVPQKQKNQKKRRNRHREGLPPQIPTEDEPTVTIPIQGSLSLQASMIFPNQQKQPSSDDSSDAATESDEEHDQYTASYKDDETNTPSAADYDVTSMPSNELIKDERLELCVLVNELSRVRSKWFHLGIQLKIEYDTLKSIRDQYANNMDECLCDMLHNWLKQPKPPPTWKTVIEALKSRHVDESKLAKQLEKEYI